jgi:hypothetical protein
VDGQDFPGPEFDDGDGGRVGDSEDFPACAGDADAEVVHAAGVADADLAAVSSSRVLTMKSRTLSSVACGLLSGLRDRGSTASRPPSR